MRGKSLIKHIRVIDGLDVAACGNREIGIEFACSTTAITCKACKDKRAKRMRTPQFLKKQAAARKAYLESRGASRLTDS